METLIEFFNWFWALKTDVLIIPFIKGNVIGLSIGYVILKWWAKRTPSTEDDELIDSIRAVLPFMKRKSSKGITKPVSV